MPDNIAFDVKLATDGDHPIVLPSGETAANAQFMRDGQDLCLKEIDGHTIRIEGYFSHNPPPDLVSADGARLTHAMVDAFLPPQHSGEYASNAAPSANDASAVGKITDVAGDATITHPDGSHIKADAGMAVHMGDVIETSAKGAVHILFSDNTTFAISESARLSIDNFTYNPDAHTGTSFFSMLHGVFVYTSGLIGKNDPGSVNIETPVGSIGIRGTEIAGDINPAGQSSTITIVDGAIVVTNGGGTLELSSSLDTATLTSYSAAPVDSGTMSAQSFDTTYSAVAPVDPSFYSMTGTVAPTTTTTTTTTTSPTTTTTPTETAPTTTTSPDTMTQATPSDAGTTVTVSSTTVQVADPYDPTVTDTSVALTDPTLSQPVSTSTFTTADTTATFGTTATSGSTSFTSGTTSTSFSSGSTLLSSSTSGGTTLSSSGTTSLSTGTTTTTTLSGGPSPLTATFQFSDPYLNLTPGTTADDGIPLFGNLLASQVMATVWAATGNTIGTVSTAGFTPTSYTLSGPGVTANAGGGWDITGNSLTFNTATTGTFGDTSVVTNQVIMHIDINASGVVTLDFVDPLGAIPYIQSPGFFQNFSITATDGTNTATSQPFVFQFQPNDPLTGAAVLLGDEQGAGSIDTFIAVGGNYVVWSKGGDDNVTVGGGDSVVFGDTGNDTLTWTGTGTAKMFGGDGDDKIVMSNPSFLSDGKSFVDGGNGTDILQLGSGSTAQTYNLEGKTNIHNIEEVSIFGPSGTTIQLDFQDVFDMNAAHTLNIQNATALDSNVIIDTHGASYTTPVGTLGGTGIVQISGVSNGQTVTLIIDQGTGSPGNSLHVTVN